MALLAPNEGETHLLKMLLVHTSGAGTEVSCRLRLFTNDLTPGETTAKGDVTECTFTGYPAAGIELKRGVTGTDCWSISGDLATYGEEKEFTFTTGGTVYGYYVTSNETSEGDRKLLWLERFTASANIPSEGGTIKITPKVTLA